MIISIDPGLTGAVSVFRPTGEFVTVFDIPVVAKSSGKGQQISAKLLSDEIQHYSWVQQACIERVGAMPGQGVTSMFGFGRSLGVIEGICAGQSIPVDWVTPQAWKKHFGIQKKDKDAARSLVIEKLPKHSELFKRKKDIGRADAVLIGLYHLNRIARAA